MYLEQARRRENIQYSEEEIARQAAIVYHIMKQGKALDELHAVFIAGGAGSGKGYVIESLVKDGVIPDSLVHIDIDMSRTFLIAWNNDTHWPKLQATVDVTNIEAGLIAQIAAIKCSILGISFLYDGTFRNLRWNLGFIRRLMKSSTKPFKLCLILVDTNPEACKQRAKTRADKEGRPTDDEFVLESNEQARHSAFIAKDFVELFIQVKNNGHGLEFTEEDATDKLRKFLSHGRLSCKDQAMKPSVARERHSEV